MIIDEPMRPYVVTFVGEYFSMATTVELDMSEADMSSKSREELLEVAEDLAVNILNHHYGWDMRDVATVEIDVQEGMFPNGW